jgi:hypothetical protein
MLHLHRCDWMLCITAYPDAQFLYIEFKIFYGSFVTNFFWNLDQLSTGPVIANARITMQVLVV